MSRVDLTTRLGPVELKTPLVGAAGTVGSVGELREVADLRAYGAAVAKSVSGDPWSGRPAPRLAPAGVGMLNGIGIQNPGVDVFVKDTVPGLVGLGCPVWGSAVGRDPEEFARVAALMEAAGIPVVEINLSCPNLEDGRMFALDPARAADVMRAVRGAVDVPIGAKLSPNSEDIVAVADACAEAGADWVVLTNTVWGAAIDIETRRPTLTGLVGGYSGMPLKPIALRCVIEVHRALPGLPILGCGGVTHGRDVVEYLLAGASAVAIGTSHFAEPRVATRVTSELRRFMRRHRIRSVTELVGAMEPW